LGVLQAFVIRSFRELTNYGFNNVGFLFERHFGGWVNEKCLNA
jgi:hypothetical protein